MKAEEEAQKQNNVLDDQLKQCYGLVADAYDRFTQSAAVTLHFVSY